MPYLGQSPSKGDENNFKILDDISSYTLTFDGSDSSVVSAANDTITSLNHRFVQGQRVTYNKGGGTVITGLSDGVYYIIKHDHHTIKLATSASNANSGTAVNITNVGSGSSHTLNVAFDGINTKFKATHTNGQKAKITRSAQLVISVNGVIQQPHDTATPSTGFGFDLDGTIVLSQAPVAGDVYWAHVLTNNNVTFDISDNDVDNFTGDGSKVSFNLSKTPPDNRNVLVTIDGVVQYPNDPDGTVRAYTVVENVLTFTTAPASATEIQVRHIGFAGSSSASGGVTNFYGRTGAVVLKNTDNIVANNAEFAGNLTVQGTMTTLDTKVTEVDQLEVAANNSTVGVAITQSGTGDILNLYDGSNKEFSVVDGGTVYVSQSMAFQQSGRTTTAGLLGRGSLLLAGTQQTDFAIRSVPHNSNLVLGVGVTERLRITSDGKVGINDNNPANQLVVKAPGASGHTVASVMSGDATTRVTMQAVQGTEGRMGMATNHPLALYAGGLEKLRIETSGDLQLYNADSIIHTSADTSRLRLFGGSSNSVNNGAALTLHGVSHSSGNYADLASGSGGHIQFRTGTNERLRIKNDGKVGIGTDNPGTLLHLSSSNPLIRLTDTDNNLYSSIGGESGHLYFYTNSTGRDFIFRGSTEVARLTGDGLLGIGTVNPTSTLEINNGSPKIVLRDSDNGADVSIANVGGAAVYTSDSDALFQKTDGTEMFRVGANGNVYFAGTQSGNNRGILYNAAGYFGMFGSSSSGVSRELRFFRSSAANSEVMRLVSTGITLHSANGGGVIYGDDGATGELILRSASGNVNHSKIEVGINEGSDNGGIHFYTAGSTVAERRVTIKGTNGRVGINSATPEFEMDVMAATGVTNTTLCVKGRGTGYSQLRLEGEGGASENYLTSTTVPLSIYVGSGGQKAKIDTGGRLLIGAGGADHYLHIKQNAETTYAKIESTHTGSTYTGINLRTPTLNFQIWNQGPNANGYSGSNSVVFWQAAATGPYGFFHGNSERLRILANGHINIGSDYGTDTGMFKVRAADGDSDDLYVGQFENHEATAGRCYGVNIRAGSNSTDHGFRVMNRANDTTQFLVRGDGNIAMGGETNPTSKLLVRDDYDTETIILKLRNYKSGVNTKPTLRFEAVTSAGQGASSDIQGLAGTDAGGANNANESGLKFIVRHGGSGTVREAYSIKKDGNIHFPNGQGVDFGATEGTSNTSSEDSLFHDYEKGLWTPTVTGGIDGVGTFSIVRGWYIKVGDLVQFSFFVRFVNSATGSTGNGNHFKMGGLPYAAANLTASYTGGGMVTYTNCYFNNSAQIMFHVYNNTTQMEFHSARASAATLSGASNNRDIYGTGTYRSA